MRAGIIGRRRKLVAPSMARNHGLRHSPVRKRWHDDWAYLVSNPANAKWIADSIAEADLWREYRGAPPFERRCCDEEGS